MKDVNSMLSKRMEGKLFVNIYLTKFGDEYSITKNHYTVNNGLVYAVDGGIKTLSGDKLMTIEIECKRIGIYDSKKTYKQIVRYYSYSEIKKKLKL